MKNGSKMLGQASNHVSKSCKLFKTRVRHVPCVCALCWPACSSFAQQLALLLSEEAAVSAALAQNLFSDEKINKADCLFIAAKG